MGKGDKKTKRGKIIMGSYGKKRPRRDEKRIVIVEKPEKAKVVKDEAPVKKVAEKKAVAPKTPVKKTTEKVAEKTTKAKTPTKESAEKE